MKRYILILSIGLLGGISSLAKNHVQIAEENSPAIVAVNVLREDASTFTGTGFVVSEDGLIATSRHVIDNAMYMNITFNTGAISGQAVPFAVSDQVDLALLRIEAKNLPTVTLADSDYVLPGQEITVIGNPRRLQNSISSGLISQVRQRSDGTVWHQISAPISPSSSGSPVFDEHGNVVSVAFSSYAGEGNQNLNFAVPSNYLIGLLREKQYNPAVVSPLDTPPSDQNVSLGNKFKNHVKKSWEILMRLFH